MIGLAQTGSGKTAAFAIPILQTLLKNPQGLFAVVLSPTRYIDVWYQTQLHTREMREWRQWIQQREALNMYTIFATCDQGACHSDFWTVWSSGLGDQSQICGDRRRSWHNGTIDCFGQEASHYMCHAWTSPIPSPKHQRFSFIFPLKIIKTECVLVSDYQKRKC